MGLLSIPFINVIIFAISFFGSLRIADKIENDFLQGALTIFAVFMFIGMMLATWDSLSLIFER